MAKICIVDHYRSFQFERSPLWLHADLPEPDDLFTAAGVVSVDGVSLPVCQVDLLHTTQHYLERDKFHLDKM